MRFFSLFALVAVAAVSVTAPVATYAAEEGEVSDSAQFVYRALRRRAIFRPSHRSVERLTDEYRQAMARNRRSFQSRLAKIEEVRDEVRDEFVHTPDEGQDVLNQDFTPYHWNIRRRHVRHQYWDGYFQRGTPAHTGQGLLGQPSLVEEEEYRNDIEVDAGGR